MNAEVLVGTSFPRRWEYRAVGWVDIQGVWLNKFGEDGWELVSIVGNSTSDATYYFKREIA